MKNELVHTHRGEVFTSSTIIAEKLEVEHTKLLRTIRRVSTHGIEDEIIPSTYKNKMNREYTCYLLSNRVVHILEAFYLFQGYGDSNGYDTDYTPYKKPDTTYVMRSANGTYKIGCTSNINTRLQAIQVGNDNFIEVMIIIGGGKETEQALHDKFKEYHVNGEWFNLPYNFTHVIEAMRNDRKIPHFMLQDTLESLLFDLSLMSDDNTELEVIDFTTSRNIKVLGGLKLAIQDGMDRKLPYKEIYKYAKTEVEDIVDSLCFKRIN